MVDQQEIEHWDSISASKNHISKINKYRHTWELLSTFVCHEKIASQPGPSERSVGSHSETETFQDYMQMYIYSSRIIRVYEIVI